jgi:hypothetical protein
MKKYLIWSLFLALIVGSCQQKSKNANAPVFGKYGDTTFTTEGAVNGQELLAMLKGKDSVEVKLKAPINACCQKKGCWMNVDLGKEVEMRVKFKDYGFFVPFNSSGHVAIMNGTAYIDTVSVAELKHLAEDEELSQKEIDAITEPEIEYTFMASGVIIE